MPLPNTKPDRSALSQADLNPLQNPLLAANMGRWAEVYFTNPPEKREEAVSELVRQLQREAGPGHAEVSASDEMDREEVIPRQLQEGQQLERAPEATAPDIDPPQPETSTDEACSDCGHMNAPGQRFCGMCGGPLDPPQQLVPRATAPEGFKEASQTDSPAFQRENDPAPSSASSYGATEVCENFDPVPEGEVWRGDACERDSCEVEAEESRAPSFGVADEDLPHFARESQPVPYRYRLYVGIALAIIVAALIYAAQRGNPFSSGQESPASKTLPVAQSPSPAAETASPQSPSTQESNAQHLPQPSGQTPDRRPPRSVEPQSPVSPKPVATASLRPRASGRQEAQTPLPARVPASATRVNSIDQTGGEELAQAESYLSGSRGATRNSQEAAQLLWKAVAKGNAAATLTLSDLYLRGDGVPQSCDQARLLLDVAAKKGAKGAGERLRHLQAFGCR